MHAMMMLCTDGDAHVVSLSLSLSLSLFSLSARVYERMVPSFVQECT